jgi:hypothetical protein
LFAELIDEHVMDPDRPKKDPKGKARKAEEGAAVFACSGIMH